MSADKAAIEKLMERCQIGVGGRNALGTAHDIMAECYGTLGALLDEVERHRAESERLRGLLFDSGAMADAPCFACGYDGPGYFDSSVHACAAQHRDGFGSDGEESYVPDVSGGRACEPSA